MAVGAEVVGHEELNQHQRNESHCHGFFDAQAKVDNPATKRIPLKALLEFERVREMALPAFNHIDCPLFIAIGEKDRTIHSKTVSLLTGEFENGHHIERHSFKRSRHLLAIDIERKQLAKKVVAYCERVLQEYNQKHLR